MKQNLFNIKGFKKDIESFSILAVAPFLLLSILTLTGVLDLQFSNLNILILILGDILFFNITHIGLAYWQFISLPEMKEWRASRTKKQWLKMSAALITVGAFPFIALMSVNYYKVSGETKVLLMILVTVIAQFIRTQHIVYQHMGMSFLYNAEIHLDPKVPDNEKLAIRKNERVERWGFHLFVWASFLYFVAIQMFVYFPKSAHPYFAEFRQPLKIILWLLVAAILINVTRSSRLRKTHKPLFLTRLAMYPFGDWVAQFAIRFFHGIEYLVIYIRMQSKTKAKNKSYFPLGMILTVSVILGLLVFRNYPWDIFSLFNERTFLIALLSSLSLTSGYIHFYLDSVLFQMRDQETRRIIGPLILK